MQPLFISNTSSSASTTRSLSIPSSPNSFTITAYFWPCCSVKILFRRVVFQLPENRSAQSQALDYWFAFFPSLICLWTTIPTSTMNFDYWSLRCEATSLGDVFNAAVKARIDVFFHISAIITNYENWRRVMIGIAASGPSV